MEMTRNESFGTTSLCVCLCVNTKGKTGGEKKKKKKHRKMSSDSDAHRERDLWKIPVFSKVFPFPSLFFFLTTLAPKKKLKSIDAIITRVPTYVSLDKNSVPAGDPQ